MNLLEFLFDNIFTHPTSRTAPSNSEDAAPPMQAPLLDSSSAMAEPSRFTPQVIEYIADCGVAVDDVIGGHRVDDTVFQFHYCERNSGCCGGGPGRRLRQKQIDMARISEGFEPAWVKRLFLVIVNPVSGKKQVRYAPPSQPRGSP